MPTRVLMVCLGNICRSPLAEGIFRDLVERRGLTAHYAIDSAGLSSNHVGEAPHRGSVAVAARHGIDLTTQRARQVSGDDHGRFDWLIAMDTTHRNALLHMAPPGFARERVRLLMDFAEFGPRDIPDPYYTGGFDEVFGYIRSGCEGLLDRLESDRAATPTT